MREGKDAKKKIDLREHTRDNRGPSNLAVGWLDSRQALKGKRKKLDVRTGRQGHIEKRNLKGEKRNDYADICCAETA